MTTLSTDSAGEVDIVLFNALDVEEGEGTWSVVADVDEHEEPVVISSHEDEPSAVAALEAAVEALAADGDVRGTWDPPETLEDRVDDLEANRAQVAGTLNGFESRVGWLEALTSDHHGVTIEPFEAAGTRELEVTFRRPYFVPFVQVTLSGSAANLAKIRLLGVTGFTEGGGVATAATFAVEATDAIGSSLAAAVSVHEGLLPT